MNTWMRNNLGSLLIPMVLVVGSFFTMQSNLTNLSQDINRVESSVVKYVSVVDEMKFDVSKITMKDSHMDERVDNIIKNIDVSNDRLTLMEKQSNVTTTTIKSVSEALTTLILTTEKLVETNIRMDERENNKK